jgi:hypothetical protein
VLLIDESILTDLGLPYPSLLVLLAKEYSSSLSSLDASLVSTTFLFPLLSGSWDVSAARVGA